MQRKTSLSVLLVEDSIEIARSVGDFLEAMGHEVDYAHDGKKGFTLALEQNFDVVVLDGILPRMDGLDVCRQLRATKRFGASILMLSGRAGLEDRIAGLLAGADDYLIKPFELKELNARLLALGRRERRQFGSQVLRVGAVEVDEQASLVRRAGVEVRLQPIGHQVLCILMRAYPGLVSRPELERMIWGKEMPNSDSLRSHIYQLRLALDKPFEKAMLLTVQTFGWRLSLD